MVFAYRKSVDRARFVNKVFWQGQRQCPFDRGSHASHATREYLSGKVKSGKEIFELHSTKKTSASCATVKDTTAPWHLPYEDSEAIERLKHCRQRACLISLLVDGLERGRPF